MAGRRQGSRTKAVAAALATLSLGAAVAGAVQGSAQAAAVPRAAALALAKGHGMGLQRSPGSVTIPQGGSRMFAVAAAALPASVDLSRYTQKVVDQGPVGSCAAWAIAYGMAGWFARSQGHAGAPFAPMYVYSQVNGGVDEGSSPAAVLEVLRTQGVDTAVHYARHHAGSSYDWQHKPSTAERASAAANKITGWVSLYNTFLPPGAAAVTAVKQALASGRPVALAIGVYQRFVNVGSSGLVSSSGNLGPLFGFHEVLAVGYDRRGVRIQNSWGPYWGAKGFAILDWNYIANHSYEAETIAGLATTTKAARPVVASLQPAAGSYRGGQIVTVKGSRLRSALVSIGGRTVKPLSVSANGAQLTFRVPAGTAGAAAVRISTPNGVSLARARFSYLVR